MGSRRFSGHLKNLREQPFRKEHDERERCDRENGGEADVGDCPAVVLIELLCKDGGAACDRRCGRDERDERNLTARSMVPGDRVKITVAPKGFGSENMTKMKMFTPAATQEQIIDFIADACIGAGSNPCPPIVIGVGLGGTSDKAAYLAKRALLRTVGEHNADPLYADMEQRILDKVNASGVGPQGLGGTVTALSCAIEPFGTHIAGLPCVVNISCHVTRHAEGEI